MTLPVPVLDDRTFQDIVDECKRRIPRYAPEWTEHNVSDPGVTLIELFAWMTELLLYRMNQVPRRNYIKFLDLIGVRLEPPRPARTELVFRLTAPQPTAVVIAAGTEVATQRTAAQEAIVFATERPLEIKVPVLLYALRSPDEASFYDHMQGLIVPGLRFPVFDKPPRPGNAFYLGYQGDLAAHTLLLDLKCEKVESIGVTPEDPPLAWEYWDGTQEMWRSVIREKDDTGRDVDGTRALNQDGTLFMRIPATSRPRELGQRLATWIRCVVTTPREGQSFYAERSDTPALREVQTHSVGGSVMASHSQAIAMEPLGRSAGTAGQTFVLSSPPVLPREDGETLEVETEMPGRFEEWQEVADFSAASPDDPHFTCDAASGQVQLGPTIRLPNGAERQYGRIPPQGRALHFTRYRTGGGVIGNVGKDTLTQLKSSIPYVASVTNPQPAVGGSEGESIEAAMMRGPQILRSSPRAVTAADFERLAIEADHGVARARCVSPPNPTAEQAGTIHLLLVPQISTTDAQVPDDQLRVPNSVRTTVQRYLDDRRVLNIRMVIDESAYLHVALRVELYRRPRADRDRLRAVVETALYCFVHPTVGGPDGDGWPFGRALYVSDIYGLVQSIPNVEHVGRVTMEQIVDGVAQPVAGDVLKVPAHTLLCSAAHTVTVA